MFSERTRWWISTIFHIETLFFLTIIIAVIYFWWTKDDSVFKKFLQIQQDAETLLSAEGSLVHNLPSLQFSKKPKINRSEERCREVFQQIFGVKFKSIRPDWLKNPVTGENLELDGYNPDIRTRLGKGLAFEYDGQQHSKYTKYFHRHGEEEFNYQVKKDTWKDLMCKKRGVLLIRIPYFVPYHDLERHITRVLRQHNLGNKQLENNLYD
jgi:hypothetical protein